MKGLLLAAFLLTSLSSFAQNAVVVESGTTTTAPGIGGTAQIGYAFAKGDVVTIEASASKKLERLLAFQFPEAVLGRVTFTRKPRLTFTMPEDGIAVFRFISDRDGTNKISYTVTRVPASSEVANYNTKVEWKLPNPGGRTLVPYRVAVEGD